MLVPVYIPTSSIGDFLFSTPSPAFIFCRFYDNNHSAKVISHCRFAPVIISSVEHLFMCFLASCISSVEKCLTRAASFLCILEMNPLLDALFTNIFSHSTGCLFILAMVFFVEQKHLIRNY